MNVFVKSKKGNWIMPTTPPKARVLLKKGMAKVIRCTPFSIQLMYDTDEHVQPIIIGIDDGGINVGLAAVSGEKVLYQEEVKLRTDIKSLMEKRRSYRRGRRSRLRYRDARFLNRASSRRKGRIPPSVKSKKDAIIQTVKRIPLPKPSTIIIEDCYFDFQALENPDIGGEQYQHGPLLYEKNYKTAAKTRDGNKCRVCEADGKDKNNRLEVHHIKYQRNGGSHKLSNLMTLCNKCHKEHHDNDKIRENGSHKDIKNLLKLPKQKNNFYASAAHVQQGKKYLQSELKKIARLKTTLGYITAYRRRASGMEKTHVNDAVIIANPNAWCLSYFYKTICVQNRKRSLHEATARKGRVKKGIRQKNKTQNRIAKNTFISKGFKKWDCVRINGQIGFISGFSGSYSCYIKSIDEKYIEHINSKGISRETTPLSKVKFIHSSNGRISLLQNQFNAISDS